MASLKLKIKKVVFKRKAASKREGCQTMEQREQRHMLA